MVDVSMQGAKVTFSGAGLSGKVQIQFSDEGSPFEFPDVEVAGYSMTFNGELVTWSKATPIQFSINVIPQSDADNAMRSLLYACHIGGCKGETGGKKVGVAAKIDSCTIEVPAITTTGAVTSGKSGMRKFQFNNGRMTVGSPGVTANAEGKMTARQYRFVFESMGDSK